MYHISAQSFNVLTSVSFFTLSSVTPCTSHTDFTKKNWSRSSFPTTLNTGNFIVLSILNYGGGRGGVGGYGGEYGETGGGVGGGGMRRIHCLIRLIALLGETLVSSSSLSRRGEIKGIFSIPLLPSFL